MIYSVSAFSSELSEGPIFKTQSNPIQQLAHPIQFNPIHADCVSLSTFWPTSI